MTSKGSVASPGGVLLCDVPTFGRMDGGDRAELLNEVGALLRHIKKGTMAGLGMMAALELTERTNGHKEVYPLLASILKDKVASAGGASPLDVTIEPPLAEAPTTLLLFAAFHANTDIVSMLLENGANAKNAPATSQHQTSPLRSPLHAAIAGAMHDAKWVADGETNALSKRSEARLEVIHDLVENGADPFVQDSNGHYPLQLLDTAAVMSVAEAKRLEDLKVLMIKNIFPQIPAGAVVRPESTPDEVGNGEYIGASGERLHVLAVCEDKSAVGELQEALLHDVTIATMVYPVPGEEVAETTALFTAARAGNDSAVKLLLAYGADVNFQTRQGDTALHVACFRGHSPVVHAILEVSDPKQRPDLDLRNQYGETCTDVFAEGVSEETREEIKALLRSTAGAMKLLKAAKGKGENPLDALREHLEDPSTDVDTIYDVSIIEQRDNEVLQSSASRLSSSSLSTSGSGSESRKESKRRNKVSSAILSSVGRAASYGLGVLQRSLSLVASGIWSEKSPKRDPVTLCTYAARHGHDAGVTLLLNAGALPDAAPAGAKSALMEAATNAHFTTAQLLLDAGADPLPVLLDQGMKVSSNMRALLEEVAMERKVVLDEDKEQEGTKAMATELEGLAPHMAAMDVVKRVGVPLDSLIEWLGTTEVVEGNKPADRRYAVKSEGGEEMTVTLLYCACEVGRSDCVELLLQHGADTGVPCGPKQSTALHVAAYHGHARCVSKLLTAGADPAYLNNSGELPGVVFDDNALPDEIEEICTLLQSAREAARVERELGRRKCLAEFVRTLPDRHMKLEESTAAAAANMELERVFHRAFETNGELRESFTEDSMLAALTSTLIVLLKGKHGAAQDPLSRMFRTMLSKEASKHAAAAVRAVEMDEWYKVPLPALFPTVVLEHAVSGRQVHGGVPDVVGTVHFSTAMDLIQSLCDENRLFSMCRPLADSLREFVSTHKPSPNGAGGEKAVVKFVVDVASHIRTQSYNLIAHAVGLGSENQFFTRHVANGVLLRTCAEEVVLPQLLNEFDEAKSLFPRPGLLRSAVSDSNPRAIVDRALACADSGGASRGCVWDFIDNVAVPSFGPTSPYEDGANVAKEYLSRAQKLVEKQRKSPTCALLALDGLAVRMLYRRPVEAIKEWMQRGDWAQQPLTLPADAQLHIIRNEYSRFVTTTLCNEKVTIYRNPKMRMTKGHDGKRELVDLPPWQPAVFESCLLSTDSLRTFITTFASRAKPQGSKSAASWNTFTKALLETGSSLLPDHTWQPVSFHAVVLHFLRPLALHFAWAHLPAYEKLDQVHRAVQENDVVLIEASTGCGKSTVIPQSLSLSFLLEAINSTNHGANWQPRTVEELWPGLVGIPFSMGGLRDSSCVVDEVPLLPRVIVTQPRREPARSVAANVATVYGQRRVGHQIGGAHNPNPLAELQYFTDALFLGRVLSNETFAGVAAVIIDEVHERSATMDLLYQALILRQQALRAAGRRAFKIILASATVDPQWFLETASLSNKIGKFSYASSFAHVDMLVESPHKTIDCAPHSGTLMFCTDQKERNRQMKPGGPADGQLNGPTRAQLAAREAFEIISAGAVSSGSGNNKQPKVLVFMPHVKEITDAKAAFDKISGGVVVSGALHAKTQHPRNVLASSCVVFANNIAETSITVPDLTHVIDLNLSVTQKADGPDDWVELSVTPSTQSSLAQRRGRVGRTADGIYIPFYCPVTAAGSSGMIVDKSSLPTLFEPQAERMPNEDLAQMEMRVQYFLGRSLFQGGKDLPTVGKGLAMRWLDREETEPLTQHIPSEEKTLRQAATLNLTAGLALALGHATKEHTCPQAIAWLSAIMQAREAPLPFNKRVPQKFLWGPLGKLGDFGLFLEVMKDFFSERKAFAQKIGSGTVLTVPQCEEFAEGYAEENAPLNGIWLRMVAERIDAMRSLCASVLPDCNPFLIGGGPEEWQAEHIEEALCVAYWRHALRLVESPSLKLADSFGPYRSINPAQLSKVRLATGGPWTASAVSTLPKWLLCYRLQRFGDPPYLYSAQSVVPVSEETLRNITAIHAPEVKQTVALIWSQFGPAQYQLEGVTQPNWCAGVEVSIIKKEGNVDPGFCEGTKRRNLSFMNYYCEYSFSGLRVDVANAIEDFSEIVKQSLAAHHLSAIPTTRQEGFTLPAPKPVTPQQLQSIWPKCYERFMEAVGPRNDLQIHEALRSRDRRTAGRALMNVLVTKWGIRPKGGPVRDLVVMDRHVNDIDANAPPQKIERGEEMNFIDEVRQDLHRRFQCLCTTTQKRPNNEGITFEVLPSGVDWSALEVDVIFEHCERLYQHNDSDFTCNNLWLTPDSCTVGLEQKLSCFGIPTAAILQEMQAAPKPQTTVLKEVSWGVVPQGKTPEGRARNAHAKGMNRYMQKRIDKFRKKAFWLLEVPPQIKGDYITLYHGCSKEAANAIKAGMFKPGQGGNLGPGVYMSRDVGFCNYYSSGGMIQAEVHVGRKVDVNGFVGSTWHRMDCTGDDENDTAFLPQAKSPRSKEEWCIRDPATRKLVEFRNIRDYP